MQLSCTEHFSTSFHKLINFNFFYSNRFRSIVTGSRRISFCICCSDRNNSEISANAQRQNKKIIRKKGKPVKIIKRKRNNKKNRMKKKFVEKRTQKTSNFFSVSESNVCKAVNQNRSTQLNKSENQKYLLCNET